MRTQQVEQVVQKLQALAPNRIDEVEDLAKLRLESIGHDEALAEYLQNLRLIYEAERGNKQIIDFLRQRDNGRELTQAAMATSEPALNSVWNNADDAEYDALRVRPDRG
ncbi:MAG: hypothetical protein BECKG1743D_GA0114223_100326 [Candidatus Kentron sp. G]|nr:MAG: hypothetical protein BECKG1743F_GA0114225_100357 [Candidatus Kentron sp. G]VFM95986.1 MAG: hypothetical protein BECKG1743E_GA0114224_100296 [Candidatus Kentron sp. G]VFM97821.1 MAG: hypothetical protein BECKG1743D_GA0114223_100326 [Candidatus Kentron sp. G]